ncbi:MAG: hypothetical protein HY646_20925 [Acidobacteria bacterium]|nr:hypothetical protein [Acidobacteriota bacterium]
MAGITSTAVVWVRTGQRELEIQEIAPGFRVVRIVLTAVDSAAKLNRINGVYRHRLFFLQFAYGVRDVAAPPPEFRAAIAQVVDRWLGARTVGAAQAPTAPPLSSFKELEPPKPKAETRDAKPAGFVCEDDVRSAVQGNSKISIGKKTIITPSARELGEANDVFVVVEA